jgi:hypothetical protein
LRLVDTDVPAEAPAEEPAEEPAVEPREFLSVAGLEVTDEGYATTHAASPGNPVVPAPRKGLTPMPPTCAQGEEATPSSLRGLAKFSLGEKESFYVDSEDDEDDEVDRGDTVEPAPAVFQQPEPPPRDDPTDLRRIFAGQVAAYTIAYQLGQHVPTFPMFEPPIGPPCTWTPDEVKDILLNEVDQLLNGAYTLLAKAFDANQLDPAKLDRASRG